MKEFDARAEFPKAGITSAHWSFGQGDASGQFLPFQLREETAEGPFLRNSGYPYVRVMARDYFELGGVYNQGELLVHPAGKRLTTLTDAVIRFSPPATGLYDVSIEVKAVDIGSGGPLCRVVKGKHEVLGSHLLAKHFGSRWKYTARIHLDAVGPLSLHVGPSSNGDHASDTTQVHFRIRPLSRWESIRADVNLSTAALAMTLLCLPLSLVGLVIRRRQKLRRAAPVGPADD